MRRGVLAAAALALAVVGCGRREPPARSPEAPSDKATISLERVAARTDPASSAPTLATLERGAEIRVENAREGYWKIRLPAGGEAWIPSGSFERESDRQARERRTQAVAGFTPQPGRALESCPVFLAPDYGAARWGDLEDGDDVAVLLADHDFYGVRLGKIVAFVPARSIRLLPSEVAVVPTPADQRPRRDERVPSISSPPSAEPTPEPLAAATPVAAVETEDDLPPGAQAPVLVDRVEPRYPELARRTGAGGDVVLRIAIGKGGTVTGVTVLSGAPGLTEAAVDAVRRWVYRPALVDGQPVPVSRTVRIRFTPAR